MRWRQNDHNHTKSKINRSAWSKLSQHFTDPSAVTRNSLSPLGNMHWVVWMAPSVVLYAHRLISSSSTPLMPNTNSFETLLTETNRCSDIATTFCSSPNTATLDPGKTGAKTQNWKSLSPHGESVMELVESERIEVERTEFNLTLAAT